MPDLGSERRRLAAALRDWSDWLVTADDHQVAELATVLPEPPIRPPGPTRFAAGVRTALELEPPEAATPGSAALLVGHPLHEATCGAFPPMRFEGTGERSTRMTITFGPAFEGPPLLVHGGFLSAAFDMALSELAHRVAGPSVTRRLRLRFLRAAPLGDELTFDLHAGPAGRHTVPISGKVRGSGGPVLASAEAEFVPMATERFSTRAE